MSQHEKGPLFALLQYHIEPEVNIFTFIVVDCFYIKKKIRKHFKT